MNPDLFTLLVQKLETQSVFENNSSNRELQIAVKR